MIDATSSKHTQKVKFVESDFNEDENDDEPFQGLFNYLLGSCHLRLKHCKF